jgi:hypothetical protein
MATLRQSQLPKKGDGYSLRFKPVGDWKTTMKVIQRLPRSMKDSSVKAQLRLGQLIVKKVKAHIRNQDLGWKPLKKETADAKNRYGLDDKILWGHGTYYRSITVWESGMGRAVFVGVKRNIYTRTYRGRKSKIEVAQIAAIHEFSSGRKIPKRPLWNPTIKEMGGAQGFKEQFVKSFKAYLRRAGIPFKDLRL